MNNPIILLSTALLLLVMSNQSTYGQQKFEQERRIKIESVPVIALDFINALEITSKIKWYSEVGLEGKSIEAKFKLYDKPHSVEFDTMGKIQDVEIKIKWQNLQSQAKDSINSQISRVCSRYKIFKTQIQYSGGQTKLLSFLQGKGKTKDLIIKYEIIVRCVNNNQKSLFEYVFNNEAKLIKTSKIIFDNSSNLEY